MLTHCINGNVIEVTSFICITAWELMYMYVFEGRDLIKNYIRLLNRCLVEIEAVLLFELNW